jgi:uncharacterized YccA/Bax inhibitor family protein
MNPLLRKETVFSQAYEATDAMSLAGTLNKTGVLLLLCLGAGVYGWVHPELSTPWLWVGLIGGFVAVLVGAFKPAWSPVLAPTYAVLEGLVLGFISRMYEGAYAGIVPHAVLLTFGVLALMLVLFTTRIIRVTQKLAAGIVAATAAVALVYFIDIMLHMFGHSIPYLHQSGLLGIGISVAIVGIAAFNLLLDFNLIEQGVRGGSPKYMEWYSGMALLITLVWLYLELLRLLSKLRARD